MQSIGGIYKTVAFIRPTRGAQLHCVIRFKSQDSGKSQNEQVITKSNENPDLKSYYYPNTSVGIKERKIEPKDGEGVKPLQTPYPPFPDGKNPKTGESGGPTGPEPTRFGDWERKGRVTDF